MLKLTDVQIGDFSLCELLMFNVNDEKPFSLLSEWIAAAELSEINDPLAAALATVGEDGFPSVRMVLVKEYTADSLYFFTNYGSRKAKELDAIGKAALCFHWKSLRRQVRFVGNVERADSAISDRYHTSRAYASRVGAWASRQSEVLESRDILLSRVAEFEQLYPDDPPRPSFWGGYRLYPHEIEFWCDGEARLHDRFRFLRDGDNWSCERLYP